MPESPEQGEEQQKKTKPKSTPGTQARRLVRNAKRAANDGEPTPQAEFLMQEANVMATLDLAAAIREQGQEE